MIRSMTGYGRAQVTLSAMSLDLEIRSLNSRFLDASIKLPAELAHLEGDVKQRLQTGLNRGKVTLTVNFGASVSADQGALFDPEAFDEVVRQVAEMKKRMGDNSRFTLQDVLPWHARFSGLDGSGGMGFSSGLGSNSDDLNGDNPIGNTISGEDEEAFMRAVDEAIAATITMRQKEGDQLRVAMETMVQELSTLTKRIGQLAEERAVETKAKLRERVEELLEGTAGVDEERMQTEIAILADKMDISEELVRLQSHIDYVVEAIQAEEPMGRQLNFLSQELNRELNTISSKSYSSEIAHMVVQGKEKVEQLREQIQNIE
ncbi:MAG: DUF1732 domain-containing protein [Balneolaceae bacterium]|nr:DUF1732 domain-containing protein [Balneolaceae bacterium]